MQTKHLVLIILFLIISGTLINSNVFIYETLIAYFLYTIIGAGIIAIASAVLLNRGYTERMINLPIIIMTAWIVYLLLHAFILNDGMNLRYNYLVISGLIFISCTILFSSIKFNFIHLYRGLVVLVIVESFICIAQYYNLFESKSIYFDVTGTWVNPNVTAMFMAMSIPALWFIVKNDILSWKGISLFAITICAISLLFLQCRTAIIGAVVGTIIISSSFEFFKSLINRVNKITKAVTVVALICITVLSGFYLYQSKKASSEGRQLIWKVSMTMIQEQPLTGYGYGMFERNYNLFQAEYFREGNATEKELHNSGHVRMAYNEILENTIEGGIIGLLLFVGFLVSLIYYYLKDGKGDINLMVAFAGVIVFAIMSLVNFTIQAIPSMALFVIYAGVIASSSSNSKKTHAVASSFQYSKRLALFAGLVLLGGSIFILISQLQYSNAHFQLKSAILKYNNNDLYGSLHIYKKLNKRMERSEGYFKEYAKLLMKLKKYSEAVEQIEKAERITSHPDIFIDKGYCYARLGNKAEAEQSFQLSLDIQPNRFTPRFYLMKLYLSQKDSIGAKSMAKKITELEPKVRSNETDFFKSEAIKILGN